jgi:hypothetical protein
MWKRRRRRGGRRTAQVIVARTREGSRGEEMDRERKEATRGHVQKLGVELRVRHRRRQEQSRGEAVVPEEDEAGRCQWDLFAIPKNFRDLSIN